MSDGLKHASFAEMPVEKLNPLLDRQFVHGEQGMLARLILRKGCVVPEHSHANEQFGIVISGSVDFTIDGETGGAASQAPVPGRPGTRSRA